MNELYFLIIGGSAILMLTFIQSSTLDRILKREEVK